MAHKLCFFLCACEDELPFFFPLHTNGTMHEAALEFHFRVMMM